MEITWILIAIFAFCTMVFLALAFFLPEWVGISKPNPHGDPEPRPQDQASESSIESKPQP